MKPQPTVTLPNISGHICSPFAGHGRSLYRLLLPGLCIDEWLTEPGEKLRAALQPGPIMQIAPLSARLSVPWEVLFERPVALIAATVGAIPDNRAHLLALGKLKVSPNSILDRLNQLIACVQGLDTLRIRLVSQVITPLTMETIKITSQITQLENSQKELGTAIAGVKKRIGELEIEKKNEAEVAANLIKAFGLFFTNITTAGDKTRLSSLAQAVLREHILTFSHVLRLSVVSGGSEMVSRKFAWWALRPAFIGGCAITYTLARTANGQVVKSGLKVKAGQRNFSFRKPTDTTFAEIPIS